MSAILEFATSPIGMLIIGALAGLLLYGLVVKISALENQKASEQDPSKGPLGNAPLAESDVLTHALRLSGDRSILIHFRNGSLMRLLKTAGQNDRYSVVLDGVASEVKSWAELGDLVQRQGKIESAILDGRRFQIASA